MTVHIQIVTKTKAKHLPPPPVFSKKYSVLCVCVTPHPHTVHRRDLAQQQEVQMFRGTGDDSRIGLW